MRAQFVCSFILLTGLCAPAVCAQDIQSANDSHLSSSGINLIARTTVAVNYRRGETTHVDLKGTDLMPELTGKAKIINKSGLTDIHVDVENLRLSRSIDPAYLTYVLWTVSPQGQAKNVGELLVKNAKASLHTTTNLQSFALVITEEPDFAVAQPSELVVGENSLRPTTEGQPESVTVRYEVFPRSIYVSQVAPIRQAGYENDEAAPLDLLEARNAVRIARDAHADQYAPEILRRAETLLDEAEQYYSSNHSKKTFGTAAREAVQTAEEARVSSLQAEQKAELERRQQETEGRAAQAQTQAEQSQDEAQRAQERAQAEARERAAAERQSQQSADEAQQARQQAQAEAERRRQLEEQQRTTAQKAEQAQQQADQAQQQAQQAQQQAQSEADRRAAAEQQNQQITQQSDEARRQANQAQQRAQQAESQQSELRQRLRAQLNEILETRDSARGLIVSMPDVLFATGSANLKPDARERLAKVAGVLIAYPDMHIDVNGYTDSTGNPLVNQQLSQERAAAVQAYLTQQGVSSSSIGIHGLGEANPIASNDSANGRQQNRRVELVVSGQSIGTAQLMP